MRPRVRSYGDNSTFTRSPARMRMKFLRIFPDACASTSWPEGSWTRNCALGSFRVTTPSTSMASAFGIFSSPYFVLFRCFDRLNRIWVQSKNSLAAEARLCDMMSGLEHGHVGRALLTPLIDHVKLNALALGQGSVAAGALDPREVNEHVLPVLRLDEAIALGVVKPFHDSGHQRPPFW